MIIGEQGPAVVISAETAFYLERICNVAGLRNRVRDGRHLRVSQELTDLRRVAMTYDPTQLPADAEVGRKFRADGEDSGQGMTVAEAADLLGRTERAVRLACAQDRLDAEKVGGQWRINLDREAMERKAG